MSQNEEVVNLIRDSSIILSKCNELEMSKKLIDMAQQMRPNGPVIDTQKRYVEELIDSKEKYILNDVERIKYYMSGHVLSKEIFKNDCDFSFDKVLTYQRGSFENIRNNYLDDLSKIFSGLPDNVRIPIQIGDGMTKGSYPVFCKARVIGDKSSMLLKLNSARHWDFDITSQDIHWSGKRNNVVWRGTTTGPNDAKKRVDFVSKYMCHHDVGLSSITKYKVGKIDTSLVKGVISLKDQLKNKFIVSLEGNDVATNLKWILSSNSIPVMPHPTKETWAMEGLLKPFYHYLPLNDDLSNLDEILYWAKDNDEQCQKIAINGKVFMSQFNSSIRELYLQRIMIMSYFSGGI